MRPRATFSISGSSYLNVTLTTVHHLCIAWTLHECLVPTNVSQHWLKLSQPATATDSLSKTGALQDNSRRGRAMFDANITKKQTEKHDQSSVSIWRRDVTVSRCCCRDWHTTARREELTHLSSEWWRERCGAHLSADGDQQQKRVLHTA